MRVYADTSVLVAMLTGESTAANILSWRREYQPEVLTADWTRTEFASALSLKQRTGQLSAQQVQAAWQVFLQLCVSGIGSLPIHRDAFDEAAELVRRSATGLRAADALHLAVALRSEIPYFATLDNLQRRQAEQSGLRIIF